MRKCDKRNRNNCTNLDKSLTKHNFLSLSSTYDTYPVNESPIWYDDKSHSQSLTRKQTLVGDVCNTSLKMSSSSDDISISTFVLNDSKIWQQIDNNRIFRWISWWSVVFDTPLQIFCTWIKNKSLKFASFFLLSLHLFWELQKHIQICPTLQYQHLISDFHGTTFSDKHRIHLWKTKSFLYSNHFWFQFQILKKNSKRKTSLKK